MEEVMFELDHEWVRSENEVMRRRRQIQQNTLRLGNIELQTFLKIREYMICQRKKGEMIQEREDQVLDDIECLISSQN